jgi:hypothetical protein
MNPAPALYTIRISGHLGAMMLSAFPALTSSRQGTDTVLSGLLDRSALHGVLAEIDALGLDLLEVRLLVTDTESPEPQLPLSGAAGRQQPQLAAALHRRGPVGGA